MNEELVNVPMGFYLTSLDNPVVTSQKSADATPPQNPNLRAGAGATPDTVDDRERALNAITDEVAATTRENASVFSSGGTQIKQVSVETQNADGTSTVTTAKVPQRGESAFDPSSAQYFTKQRGFKRCSRSWNSYATYKYCSRRL